LPLQPVEGGIEGEGDGLGPQGRELDPGAQVMHRDQPVLQGVRPLGRGPVLPAGHAPPPGGDRLGHPLALEQGLVEGGHELGRGERIDAVAHGHHRGHPLLEEPGGDGRLHLLLEHGRLAGIEHHQRYLPRPDEGGELGSADPLLAPRALLQEQEALLGRGRVAGAIPGQGPAGAATAGHPAVAVEVQDVIGTARRHRRGEPVLQLRAGGRAQDLQLHPTAHRLEPLEQRAGDHLIARVLEARGPRDDHEHPQGLAGRGGHHGLGGPREGPAEAGEIQDQRRRPLRILHELPGQGEKRRRARAHHQLRRRGLPGPDVGIAGRARAEHRIEQGLAPGRELGLDRRPARLVHRIGGAEVVLQIPAQVGPQGLIEGGGEGHRLALDLGKGLARALEGHRDAAVLGALEDQLVRHHVP
jgi:hypothetical protein